MSPATTLKRRVKMREIAHLAGVGPATVDRVLNNRKHVSVTTRQRVMQAKQALETGAQIVTSARPWRLKVFLPDNAGPSTEFLAACFQEFGSKGNATIECVFTKKMKAALLSRKLRACAGQGIDAVAFQALEDPLVHDAVAALAAHDIPALGLISGLVSANLIGLIGIDNRAAGRTAGYLMGRFTKQAGTVAVISGGQHYRAHEEREIGFRSCLQQNFPAATVVGTYCGYDDIEQTYEQTLRVIEAQNNLIGIYNVGAGNEGLIRALKKTGVTDEIITIGHNLSARTKQYLLEGSMDIVMHQNMRRAASQAVTSMIAHLENRPFVADILPVEVITRENISGITFG
jgi:LacI family transcriptional regulator